MFSLHNTIAVIYITRTAILEAVVKTGKSPQVITKKTFPWARGQSLLPIFSKIAPDVQNKSVRIVLASSLSYVINLTIPVSIKQQQERSYISKKVQEQIPELLENDSWDFKETGITGKEKKIMVFAPVISFLTELRKVLTATKIVVEALEPEGLAKERNADPIIGTALKSDIEGRDEQVLNIHSKLTIVSGQLPNTTVFTDTKPKNNSSSKRWIQLTIIVIGLACTGIGGFFLYQAMTPQPLSKTAVPTPTASQPSPTEEPSLTPTPEPLVLSDFTVQVLNGSGTAGESTRVQKLLEEGGFEDVTTGNADAFDYTDSELRMKETVPLELFEQMRQLLSDYQIVEGDVLTADSKYDVVIVVGKRNE